MTTIKIEKGAKSTKNLQSSERCIKHGDSLAFPGSRPVNPTHITTEMEVFSENTTSHSTMKSCAFFLLEIGSSSLSSTKTTTLKRHTCDPLRHPRLLLQIAITINVMRSVRFSCVLGIVLDRATCLTFNVVVPLSFGFPTSSWPPRATFTTPYYLQTYPSSQAIHCPL
jgi:hypothetical protein